MAVGVAKAVPVPGLRKGRCSNGAREKDIYDNPTRYEMVTGVGPLSNSHKENDPEDGLSPSSRTMDAFSQASPSPTNEILPQEFNKYLPDNVTWSDAGLHSLPPFIALTPPNFVWGDLMSGEDVSHVVNSAYAEAVHWHHNLFRLPRGKAAMSFVTHLALLFCAYGEGTVLESAAL